MAAAAVSERFPTQLVIGGEKVGAASGKTFPVVNPATEEELATVAEGDAADIDRAVASARTTFESDGWRGTSARRRGEMLYRLGELCLEHKDEIARLETLNNGKPLFESRIDIKLTADTLKYYGGWADKLHGETIPVDGPFFNYTLREPLGVVGAIVPWNFPLSLASWKIGPALACGNTVVLKPAEQTPFTALFLAELALEAGLPPGALNCVPGYGPTAGAALVRHPGVDKIAFTGSTDVGKQVMREAATTVKKVSLELGGKSPNIVFADADLDAAARGALTGIFYGKGEVCAAGSRLLVEAPVREALQEKILERAKRMVPGDPLHPKTRLGAIVSRQQMERVLSYIESGKREGATLLAGGERARVNGKGYFVEATIFGDVRNDMAIAREEIFGPVLAMMPFEGSVEGAAELANATIYGLAAGIWTRDITKALRAARAVRAGTVWINTYNMYDAASPFGGFKQSGFGRDLGMHALEGYTQVKSVWVNLS
ncbi:MAG TPA: aldehyde dehydrogenase family protein [Gemmatimonadaceae bacterium]|nr:aldehyde dehydrogenase family protein [Gemmatimonadaceae bacterium]